MTVKKLLRTLVVFLIAVVLVMGVLYLALFNGDMIFDITRSLGMSEEYANNVAMIIIAIQALFLTSDWLYGRILSWLEAGRRQGVFYRGLRMGMEALLAFPKRTSLFVFYLFLIVGKRVGLVSQSAADYEMLAVFVIAIDRVTKIWPTEREDFQRFWHGIKAYLSEMD